MESDTPPVRRLAEHLHAATLSLTPPHLSDMRVAQGIFDNPQRFVDGLVEVGLLPAGTVALTPAVV